MLLGLDLPAKQSQHFTHIIYYFILISAVNVDNGACVIPEASQEGPLRSFKSYEDVVMFHYSVPKQVTRATWQFTAFSDNVDCPQRKVNILLKWGSYPVISVNNASYPPHVYVDRDSTIRTTTVTSFKSNDVVLVPVNSPEPGDWFVGAYLDQWDERIHQKGLVTECRYNLGSVALWSETHGIENIPLGYQKTIVTSKTISYYKFYIPMDTWNFKADISGCNVTVKQSPNFRGPCIKNLNLKGRAMPHHSEHTENTSLTSADTYTFWESSPFQDEWYYLMVVSSSAIKFDIKVTVALCPIKTVEEVFASRYMNVPVRPRALDEFYLKDLKEKTLTRNSSNSSVKQSQIWNNRTISGSYKRTQSTNIDDDFTDSCITRHQLVRVKYSQLFSGDYLFWGRDWLTSWLTLNDKNPVVVQFHVLPLVDIGGTLDINVELDVDEVQIKQQINVTVCISRGRLPKLKDGHMSCIDNHMTMKVSSSGPNSTNIMIPYPQPDVYYIAFTSTCYVNGKTVNCKVEEILLSLNVKLRACVFRGTDSCGEFGVCEEIHKDLLYFSACKCFGGHQGWACTDATNAVSEYSVVFATLALTLSNLFFIPAIYLAIKRKLFTEALVFTSIMFFSSFYHACDQPSIGYCVAKFEVLQYCDFFLGMLAFWVTLVCMADIPTKLESFLQVLGVIIITFGVESDKTSLRSILIPLIIGCSIPLVSYGVRCVNMKKFIRPQRVVPFIYGFILVTIGVLLFSLVETKSNYQYVHSAWHAIIALSLIFLLPVKEVQVRRNKTDNKSLQCEEFPSDLVFHISGRQNKDHLIEDVT
ncbi:post-GPI attachment to proteins factor 6-like [Copidosoma floridanum]|uniref:post-GPI attachment to proteins factor 6-like n=1 Tax=Copidosoma floridanum TaxID=29053 RepID=UPI0006C9ABBF|nr:post-GPI attachment to proteins factor 6-like [Copidosoma floridanum]